MCMLHSIVPKSALLHVFIDFIIIQVPQNFKKTIEIFWAIAYFKEMYSISIFCATQKNFHTGQVHL